MLSERYLDLHAISSPGEPNPSFPPMHDQTDVNIKATVQLKLALKVKHLSLVPPSGGA